MEWLNNCYSTKVRLWIGGVERIAPITWFWAPDGAQELGILSPPPSPPVPQAPLLNSYVSNVYAKPGEESDPGPGEINRWRTWADGTNPGYRGLCFLGHPEWFRTGQLPADALAGPALPLPYCCGGVAAQTSGGLLLGGSASFPGIWPPQPSGGLLLGGSASFPGIWPAQGSGGLQLGGSAVFAGLYPPLGSGGFVLGGSAGASMFQGSGSGSGSGSGDSGPPVESCDQCPDGAAAEFTFDAGVILNGTAPQCGQCGGTQTVSYLGACNWQGPLFDIGGFVAFWEVVITDHFVILTLGGPGCEWRAPRGGWDCRSPLTLALTSVGSGCHGTASIITIHPV